MTDIHKGKKPRYRSGDFRSMVRAEDKGKPFYYPIYRTSGRTFMERDKPGPKPS